MGYSPPTGTAKLSLGSDYRQTVGVPDLHLDVPGIDRDVALGATTPGVTAQVVIRAFVGAVQATTAPAQAAVALRHQFFQTVSATTAPVLALVRGAYDPNLLSDTTALTGEGWQEGATTNPGPVAHWQPATLTLTGGPERWQAAPGVRAITQGVWQAAAAQRGAAVPFWQDAQAVRASTQSDWQGADWQANSTTPSWQAAAVQRAAVMQGWRDLPLLPAAAEPVWQDGEHITRHVRARFAGGAQIVIDLITIWQDATVPGNAPNPGPPVPPPVPPPWGATLRLRCALPGTRLRIGRTPCTLIADREVAVRRTYMSVNSASLVRWPDLTPLPCTALTIETDFDSWCWGLSATLAGPDAWALVQPNPLACEVLATINGVEWQFLLDVPSTNRTFGSDRVSLKGRSRSAWLHDPYTGSSNRDEVQAREMVQVAEAALVNTGWTLDWQLENWLIPAGRYASWNTPIGALLRLAQVTDDGLYTEPAAQVVRAVRRWPVASWLLDGETADLAIPESAVISLSQSPVYTQPYNGVYVSGISHGAIALVKIAGTDGALQPSEPLTHELLCDEAGVGARQRGLNFLSDSGAGYELDAEVLFTSEVGLVRPGLIVSIAGVKGLSRSCRISASWGGDGLTVRQSVGLERREVEDA